MAKPIHPFANGGLRKGLGLLVVGVVSVLFGAQALALDVPFSRLSNALGFADRDGNFSYWWDVPVDLWTVKSGGLPVRFHFCSEFSRPARSCLGAGWWFPLFESCLVEEDEQTVRFHSPGGDIEWLIRDKDKPDEFISSNHKWKAVDKGRGRVEVTNTGGWVMYFDKGLLSRARTDSGELLKWNRTSNGEVASVESDARPGEFLISAVYDKGLLKSLRYNESAGVSFGYDKMPVVASSAGNDIISTLKPSLSLIKDTAGEEGSFQWDLDADLKQIKMVIDQKSIEGPRPQEKYLWSTATKKLLSDIESTYDYDFEHGATNHRPIIQRRYVDQTFEEYHYDSNKGVMRNRSRDGSVLEKFYVATPSKAFGLIRNTVFTPAGAGGRPVVLFRGLLDNEGYYIRATQMSDLPGLAKETRYNKHEVVSENWIPQKIEFANNGTTVLPFRGGQLELKLLPPDGKDGGDRRAAGKGYEIVVGADDMVKQVTVPEGIKYKVLKTVSGACEIAVEYQGQTGMLGKLEP